MQKAGYDFVAAFALPENAGRIIILFHGKFQKKHFWENIKVWARHIYHD